MSLLHVTYTDCPHTVDFPSVENDIEPVQGPCPRCQIHGVPVASEIENALGYGVREFGVALEMSDRIHSRPRFAERVRNLFNATRRGAP